MLGRWLSRAARTRNRVHHVGFAARIVGFVAVSLGLILLAQGAAHGVGPPIRFRTAITYPINGRLGGPTFPAVLSIADLNNDGRPDIAIANLGIGGATIFVNDGAGGFSLGANAISGGSPLGLTSGHIDADANVDLVFTEQESSNLWLLRGRGDGTFNAAKQLLAGHDPFNVAAIDFDGNGTIDLVQSLSGELGGRINVLYNKGDATFAPLVGGRARCRGRRRLHRRRHRRRRTARRRRRRIRERFRVGAHHAR